MSERIHRAVPLFVLLVAFTHFSSFAQINIPSPYSRFGIGELNETSNIWNQSLGECGFAFRSPYHINFNNPASYTAIDSLTFLFEGGITAMSVKLSTNTQQVTRDYASIGHLLFGFPVTKWWRTTLGLVPYSDVGYNISTTMKMDEPGTVVRSYSGEGGINRFFWGNGIRINKNFNIGVNASYLFGSMDRQSTSIFPDSLYSANFKANNYITISDLYFSFGAQYQIMLKNDMKLTFGLVYSPCTMIHAKTDMVAQTFYLSSAGVENNLDTIEHLDGYKGKISIPTYIGGGIALEKTDKWLVGADYHWQNWKNFTSFGTSDSLVNSYEVNIGAEILPDINDYSHYLKRVRYRLGFLFQNTYLQLREKQLNEYAFTFGCGLPMKGNKTGLNLSFQLGSRGTTEANLIRETFFKFGISVSVNERWFVKRKYY
ncbi:MAG: hypothetical protein Q8867_03745 [Bacteroidota bacterium]|nr:hypothetical protein [Bacteroidota bacterium]